MTYSSATNLLSSLLHTTVCRPTTDLLRKRGRRMPGAEVSVWDSREETRWRQMTLAQTKARMIRYLAYRQRRLIGGPGRTRCRRNRTFNMFTALFQAKETVRLNYLGTSKPDSPPPGANFYITTQGVYCSVHPDKVISQCGDSETQYFKLLSLDRFTG